MDYVDDIYHDHSLVNPRCYCSHYELTISEIYHISDKRIDNTRWILSYGTLVALKYSSQTFCTKFYTQYDSFGWKALPWVWQSSLFLNLHSISEVINETVP